MMTKPLSKANTRYIVVFTLCCLVPWIATFGAAVAGLDTQASIRMGNSILSLLFPFCLWIVGLLAYRAGHKDGAASTVVPVKH